MTATNDGASPNNYTYALFNTTTNTYVGYSPVIHDFYATSGGTPYKTVENKLGFLINDNPVVAYDKNNDHLIIAWSMTYSESTYASSFPIGPFPAQVYANPDFDGSNDPSMQTPNSSACVYNSLDNVSANTSNNVSYMAVASHNTNDILYAWLNASTDILYRVVTSGNNPRLGSDLISENKNICYPNPYNSVSANIHLNINPNDVYTIILYNSIGQIVLQSKGIKSKIESDLSTSLKLKKSCFYQLKIEDSSNNVKQEKLIVISL
jgi:hypothetical protein